MSRRLQGVCGALVLRVLQFLLLRRPRMHSVGDEGLLDSFCRCFGRWWMVLEKVSHKELGHLLEVTYSTATLAVLRHYARLTLLGLGSLFSSDSLVEGSGKCFRVRGFRANLFNRISNFNHLHPETTFLHLVNMENFY